MFKPISTPIVTLNFVEISHWGCYILNKYHKMKIFKSQLRLFYAKFLVNFNVIKEFVFNLRCSVMVLISVST